MWQMSMQTARAVTERYDLGLIVREPVYADRGEQGRIWRVDTDRASWAVKEVLFDVPEEEAAADVAYQYAAAAAGVRLPLPVLTRDGLVVIAGTETGSPAASLRVYEWADLVHGRTVAGAELGATMARLHRVRHPARSSVREPFSVPPGEAAWRQMLAAGEAAGAEWAPYLKRWLPDLIALDGYVRPPRADRLATCHLDLNIENLRWARDGGLVLLDWENCGPAQPERELAMSLADLSFDVSVEEAVAAYGAYRAADGPVRLGGFEDFSMAIAFQGFCVGFYVRRAVDPAEAPENRDRSADRLHGILAQPLTVAYIDRLLSTVEPGGAR